MPVLGTESHLTPAIQRRLGQNAILDRGMSTLLATVAVLAVLGAYFTYQAANDNQAQISQINTLASVAKSMYQNASNTNDLVTNTIAGSGNLPPAWISGASPTASILSPTRTPITINPWVSVAGSPNDGFSITVTGLSNSSCIATLTTVFGAGHKASGALNTGNFAYFGGYGANTGPYTPTAAQGYCTGNNTTVMLYFK